jgi:exopolyphosphatase/guanosine-5'-triphosphate,3'-diphosphate pyrophosphatase
MASIPVPDPASGSPAASPACAVVDIGSNTIKLLVARRTPDGTLVSAAYRTIEARIGSGIGRPGASLGEEGMARAGDAIAALLQDAAVHHPARTALVATSAVRDAANGAAFAERIRARTGHAVRILSGDDEASLIGRGLTCDPALSSLQDFYLFDLGGGSLECLSFRARRPSQALSLRLGCVRLTDAFVTDPSVPIPPSALAAIRTHVGETLARSGFSLSLPAASPAVATGGTVSTVRAILGAREGRTLEETSPVIPVCALRALLAETAALGLEARRRIPGLPPGRADVFPCALQTLLTVAVGGRFTALHHSLFNLRWGVAEELLSA